MQKTSPDEETRVQAYLASRYSPADVRHSFTTMLGGKTIDCIDFFAQPSVKHLAAIGRPLTEIPKPPHAAHHTGKFSPCTFNGEPDENGRPRICPEGSVAIRRVTADDIREKGGLDAYLHPPPRVRPPRPGPGSGAQVTASTTTAVRHPSSATAGNLVAGVSSSTAGGGASPLIVPAPDAGNYPYCTEFELNDLPGFAHVQATAYPGGSATISTAGATLSLNNPLLGSTAEYGDHNVAQTWLYSGWAFNWGTQCSCSVSDPDRPCAQTLEFGSEAVANGSGGQTYEFFLAATNDGYSSFCENATCDDWVQTLTGGAGGMVPGLPLPSSGGSRQYGAFSL